ncbi:MAG: type I pullulanase [Ectobacillus sp.]
MLKVARVFEAYLDEMNMITVLLPKSYGGAQQFYLKHGEEEWPLEIFNTIELPQFMKYECRVQAYLELGKSYIVKNERNDETDLQIGAVIRTKEFDEAYYYDGDDLGVTYTPEQSIFKLWAPSASLAKVRIYEKNGQYTDYAMERGQNGVWSAILPGDKERALYRYLVCVNLVWREGVDPYAKAVSVNGRYGVVIDIAKTRVQNPVSLPPFLHFTDAIIYEAHIRDLTIHPESGVVHKGKYLGLTETDTRGPGGTATGLAYLKELGITHLELLPFNDFEGVNETAPLESYNWGYNPSHYNTPEGSYAMNPENPYSRISELKRMIQVLHENGLRVIMDVVYNHVYLLESSSFERLVPGYYFRYDANGMPSNGTGVGNDIASERKMVRKFIVDSVLFWLREYNVDGFRFDLMGVLDYETMNTIRREVDKVNPNVLLLGEGWDLNTTLESEKKAALFNASKMPRIAQFNDRFRDQIKGGTFDIYHRGYALGGAVNIEEIKRLIAGSIPFEAHEHSLFVEPNQTINYVESHDNSTLWDKLLESNKEENEEIRKRRHRLATTITLLSQGIPFIHAGQEFFRTKQRIENSYNAPDDINQIDWKRKVDNIETVEYIKNIIAIRKSHGAFRLPSASLIRKHMRFLSAAWSVIVYHLHDVGEFGRWKELIVIFNSDNRRESVRLPYKGEWHILADCNSASPEPLSVFNGEVFLAEPISAYVLAKL